VKSRRLLAAFAAIGMAAGVVSLGAAPAGATPIDQLIAIPAYWGPDTPAGATMFQRLAQNGPTNDLVVINGSQSMPETPFNSKWAEAIKKVHDSGRKTLLYVDSGYYGFDFGQPQGPHKTRGGSTAVADWTAQIKSDIDGWYSMYGSYGVDGIFIDQIISSCGPNNLYVNLYNAIRDYIRTKGINTYIVMNPGESPEQCYENTADTIMSMERDIDTYMNNYTPPAWQKNHPNPKKFWHAIYATPALDMKAVVTRSKENNAGYVYVTDRPLIPFPWDTLASYWDDELKQVAGIQDTTAPTAPSNLTEETRSGSTTARVFLTWNRSIDNVAVRNYEVFANGVSLGITYDNAYKATNLALSTSYTFTVKAFDVSGNVSSISSPKPITTPAAGSSLTNPTACLAPSIAKYGATFNEEFSHHRVLIDSDNNPATGYQLNAEVGADHLIENGVAYSHGGSGWAWDRIDGVSPLVSDADDHFAWQIPTSAFGSGAATTQVVTISGSGGPIPEVYSPVMTVNQTPSC
jgi:chitodextrinase